MRTVAMLLVLVMQLGFGDQVGHETDIDQMDSSIVERIDSEAIKQGTDKLLDEGYVLDWTSTDPDPEQAYWQKKYFDDEQFLACQLFFEKSNRIRQTKAFWEFYPEKRQYVMTFVYIDGELEARFTCFYNTKSFKPIEEELTRIMDIVQDINDGLVS